MSVLEDGSFVAPLRLFAVLAFCLAALSAVGVEAQEDAPARPPNIVLIVADDLGYGDVGAYGGTVIRTPHLDALAASGVRFTAGYVTHPVCGPSRAGLLTGRYQQRHGYEFNPVGRDERYGLATSERTLADRLRDAGYRTAMIGKWHLGDQKERRPESRGFDESFGFLEGASQYFDGPPANAVFAPIAQEEMSSERGNTIWRDGVAVTEREYLTDAFTREAVAFLSRHAERSAEQPFFLYLAYSAPHTPLEATREYAEPYAEIADDRTRVYAAMVAALDAGVGRVTDELHRLGQLDNTLIVFLSDNGCASYVRGACTNAPLRGFKRYHHEGGVRVPFVVHWPAGLPAGTVYEAPVSSLDLTPTFLAAAQRPASAGDGVDDLDGLDGVNLLPFLRGERTGQPHERLYWRAGPTLAVREGRFKLIRLAKSDRDLREIDNPAHTLSLRDWSDAGLGANDPPSLDLLYDLVADPGEQQNLAGEHRDVVERLTAALTEWERRLVEPTWPPLRSSLAEVDGHVVHLFY